MAEATTPVKAPKAKTSESSPVPVGYEAVITADEDSQCPTLEDVKHGNQDIWLIKVPFNFDSSSLTGQTVVMNGVQDLVFAESQNNNKKFEMMTRPLSTSLTSSCKVLLPSSRQESLWTARKTNGQMTVIQSHHVPPVDLPPCPPPTKHQPPDIRCRWKPFGSGDPEDTRSHQTERIMGQANGSHGASSESSDDQSSDEDSSDDESSKVAHQKVTKKEKNTNKKDNSKPVVKQEPLTPVKKTEKRVVQLKSTDQPKSESKRQNSTPKKVKKEPKNSDDDKTLKTPSEVKRNDMSDGRKETPSKSKKKSKQKSPQDGNVKKMKVKLERASDDEVQVVKKKKKK